MEEIFIDVYKKNLNLVTDNGLLIILIITCFSVLISFIHNWSRSYSSQFEEVELLSLFHYIIFIIGFSLRVILYSILYSVIIFISYILITSIFVILVSYFDLKF